MRDITATLARTLGVARVSVWELSEADDVLACVDLFDATTGRHTREPDLVSFPRYLASLRRSLTLAAHDARQDPRTSEFLHGYLEPLGIRSMLDAPIRRAGRVVGVLCHEHVGEAPRHWTLLDQCAAASGAGLVARALEARERQRAEQRATRVDRLRAIGQVAAGTAHDLNNLLMILIGNLDVAQDGARGADERAACLRNALVAADGVRGLVTDLLAIGMESRLEPGPLELGGWLARLEPLLRSAAGERAELALDGPGEPLVARAEPSLLQRVLVNLVRNAGEALAHSGRIAIRVAEVACELPEDALPPGRYASIAVEDTGRGMDAAVRAHLFEPFFTTKEPGAGHGLGLATSYGLVRQLGGTIRAHSRPGAGSRFEVVLPLATDGG